MHHAASANNGNVGKINALLEAGAALEATAEGDSTPLHWAASAGRLDAIKALVAAGASLDARGLEQRGGPGIRTAEKMAEQRGEMAAAKLLRKLRKKRSKASRNKQELRL